MTSLLSELVADHAALVASIPAFPEQPASARGWTLGGEHICHQADDLTIMVLDTLPGVLQPPHDHAMTAIIGVFQGQEDQRFYARSDTGVSLTRQRSLLPGDTIVLGENAIHAISAPADRPARAVHVYFGDIYAVDRSLFHPDTLQAHPYTGDRYDEFCRPDPDTATATG